MANEYVINAVDAVGVADVIREKADIAEQLAFPEGWKDAIRGIKTGVELNFEVVGGTTQPENPKENMIWVNTDYEITDWVISSQTPLDQTEGMVWIKLGNISPVRIDLMKDDNVVLYFGSCAQFVDGEFITRAALVFQAGEWIGFDVYVYSYGDQNESITGGWDFVRTGSSAESTFQIESNRVYMCHAKMTTKNAIDITPYSTMVMRLNLATRHSNGVGFQNCGLLDRNGGGVVLQHPNTLGDMTVTFDISAVNQECYINVQTGGSTYCSGYVYEVALFV